MRIWNMLLETHKGTTPPRPVMKATSEHAYTICCPIILAPHQRSRAVRVAQPYFAMALLRLNTLLLCWRRSDGIKHPFVILLWLWYD